MNNSRYLGILSIPVEHLKYLGANEDRALEIIKLPKGVKVYSKYYDWYRQTMNFMLKSLKPVDGVTSQTSVGSMPRFTDYEIVDGFIKVVPATDV